MPGSFFPYSSSSHLHRDFLENNRLTPIVHLQTSLRTTLLRRNLFLSGVYLPSRRLLKRSVDKPWLQVSSTTSLLPLRLHQDPLRRAIPNNNKTLNMDTDSSLSISNRNGAAVLLGERSEAAIKVGVVNFMVGLLTHM